MIAATARLLATRGLEGASLAEILEAAQAPRGSMYHHFPGGKDELVAEAIDLAGRRSMETMDGLEGQSPGAIAQRFLDGWRQLLVRTHYRAGCAVVATTVATQSDVVLGHADSVFASWIERLTELFVAGGIPAPAASDLATWLLAASEGAVVISRAQRDIRPFDIVARQVLEQILASSANGAPQVPAFGGAEA